MNVIQRDDVTGLVLAGGRGERMEGRDKGLVPLGQSTLVEHVLHRLAPQVGQLLINANRNRDRYAAFGFLVVPDENFEFAGPLAGILSGLKHAPTPWLAVTPCDSPFIPNNLVARLTAAIDSPQTIAMVSLEGEPQPVFALIPTVLRDSLADFLAGDQRKITRWYGHHRCLEVDFSADAQSFMNVNTAEDHAAATLLANG